MSSSNRNPPGGDKKRKAGSASGPVLKPQASPTKQRKTFDDLVTPFTPSFTSQDVNTVGNAIPPKQVVGRKFHRAIERLRDGGNKSVSTKFNLNVRVGTRQPVNIPVQGDFSVFQQGTGLVQGSLQTPGYSAYKGKKEQTSVLPEHLSPQRARLESRAFKQLSRSGQSFNATDKTLQFDELQLNRNNSIPKRTTLGGIALGSHLEDITAKRAVGLDHVGSAIRANTMAAKWTMQTEDNDNAGKGFRDKQLAAFPQLGSDTVPAGGLNKGGISALKSHWDGGGTTFSKNLQLQKIQEAHVAAAGAADGVFQHKVRTLGGGGTPTGTWWADNAERFQSILKDSRSSKPRRNQRAENNFNEIRAEYRARKLKRHGIENG